MKHDEYLFTIQQLQKKCLQQQILCQNSRLSAKTASAYTHTYEKLTTD